VRGVFFLDLLQHLVVDVGEELQELTIVQCATSSAGLIVSALSQIKKRPEGRSVRQNP
jgi:hypothetical protein